MKPGKVKSKVTWHIAAASVGGVAIPGTAMTAFIYFTSGGSRMWGIDDEGPTCLEMRQQFGLPCPDSESTSGSWELDPSRIVGDVRPPFGTPDWFVSAEGLGITTLLTVLLALGVTKFWPRRRGFEGVSV